jgi:predicted  nucleic acid-binding Zn-ribbon protein
MSRKPGMPPTEEDLEATAELPAIDFAPQTGREADAAVATDIYAIPAIRVSAPELAESLRELEQQLKREQARMQDVEAQLAAANRREAGLQAQLAAVEEQRSTLEARLVETDGQSAALAARLAEAEARYAAMEVQLSRPQVAPQATAMRPAAGDAESSPAADLDELRRCSQRQLEALTSWQGFRALSDSLLAEAEARNAQLESQVATLGDSLRALERKHHAAPPPRDNENHALKSELAGLKAEFGEMQALLSSLRDRLHQSEQQVEAEVERSRRLENEIQASVSLLGGSPRNAERPARDPGKHGGVQAQPAEAPRRALVRLQDGAEVVYPVGRRTTIGRMPDNDIQLDTANVSRHHAVLLCSVDSCIVEDLNSTNGVLVNGQRVGRQPLHDGDLLSVGKAEFRFQQRS